MLGNEYKEAKQKKLEGLENKKEEDGAYNNNNNNNNNVNSQLKQNRM
jgi:hypothetical protein